MFLKKALFLFCAASLFIVPVSAGELKIASMDTGRVLVAHPAFQEALDKYRQEIQSMQERIQEMDDEQRMAAQQMMQHQMQDFGEKLETEAFEKMRNDVKKIAADKGYSYVFDKNVLIVGGDDITEEIIAALEKTVADAEKVETE